MRLKKGFLYVFFANFINLVISIITGFVLPKYLSIDSYANIKLFQLYISYVGILHFGYADGMYLKYGGKKIEELNHKEIISEYKTFMIFQIVIVIVAISISVIIKNYILLLCSLTIIPINVSNYLKNLYQAIGKFDTYAKFTNMNIVFLFITNLFLLFIIKTDNNWIYIICYVIAYFIYWIFLEIEFRKIFSYQNVKAQIQYFFKDIKDGFFLMIGNFCSILFTSIDRLFVKNLLGTVEFAYYSFAVSVENLITVLTSSLSVVMYNYFCLHKENEKVIFVKRMVLVFSACVIAVAFPVKFIVNNWMSKYNNAVNVLFILFAAQYFTTIIRCIYNNLYKIHNKQNKYFAIMIFVIIVSIVSNIVFYLFQHSIEAFSFATLMTSVLWFIICEIDFRESRFLLKEYLYMGIIIFTYLMCGIFQNVIIGCCIYLIVLILLTNVLMKDVVKYAIKNTRGFIEKIKNKKG